MSQPMNEIDVYRSAMVLVKRYGDKAKAEAALKALQNPSLEIDGLAVWCRIVKAIEDIQENFPDQCLKH